MDEALIRKIPKAELHIHLEAVASTFSLSPAEIVTIAGNALEATFLDEVGKRRLRAELDAAVAGQG